MRIKLGANAVFAFAILASAPALAAQVRGTDDAWKTLTHVTHRRNYLVVLRDSTCLVGEITKVDDQAVNLKSKTSTVTIARTDILRVGRSERRVRGIIYSGRSSWTDVKDIPPNRKEGVLVVTTDGKRHAGKLIDASPTEITFSHLGKTRKLNKGDISEVFYVRFKPLSESAEYAAQEMFYIDPELWPYVLGFGPHIPVLLYDASLPEENSSIKCQKHPMRYP